MSPCNKCSIISTDCDCTEHSMYVEGFKDGIIRLQSELHKHTRVNEKVAKSKYNSTEDYDKYLAYVNLDLEEIDTIVKLLL